MPCIWTNGNCNVWGISVTRAERIFLVATLWRSTCIAILHMWSIRHHHLWNESNEPNSCLVFASKCCLDSSGQKKKSQLPHIRWHLVALVAGVPFQSYLRQRATEVKNASSETAKIFLILLFHVSNYLFVFFFVSHNLQQWQQWLEWIVYRNAVAHRCHLHNFMQSLKCVFLSFALHSLLKKKIIERNIFILKHLKPAWQPASIHREKWKCSKHLVSHNTEIDEIL